MTPPDRILVYGVTGSGKSTAALAIGARTGLPVTLVDELTWLPPLERVRREVRAEIPRLTRVTALPPARRF